MLSDGQCTFFKRPRTLTFFSIAISCDLSDSNIVMIVAENDPNADCRQASGGTKKDEKLMTKSRQVANTKKNSPK